jgi:hypothetical protein
VSFGRSASNVSVPVIVAAIVIALVGAAPAGGQSDEGPAPAEATPDEAAPGQEQVPVEEQQPAGDQADDEEPLPPEIEKYTAGTKEVLDEDAVFKQFERKRRIRDVLLRPFVFDAIDESWQRFNDELDDRTGLRLSFAYTRRDADRHGGEGQPALLLQHQQVAEPEHHLPEPGVRGQPGHGLSGARDRRRRWRRSSTRSRGRPRPSTSRTSRSCRSGGPRTCSTRR